MGGVLSNDFDTPVGEILIEKNEKKTIPEFEDISIGSFKDIVQQFAAKSDVRNEQDLNYINNVWSNLSNVTNGKFLSFCKLVIDSLAQIAGSLSKRRQHVFVQHIQDALISIYNEPDCTPYLQNFFQDLMKWVEEKIAKLSAGSALNNIISGAAATLKETGKNAAKQTVAKSVAKRAFATSFFIDGALLGLTATHSYYLYKDGKLSSDECKQILVERSTATAGSIGGTTTGAFVGTLLFPGVGTFLGGVVGGMVGDFLGSKIGGELYDAVKDKDSSV